MNDFVEEADGGGGGGNDDDDDDDDDDKKTTTTEEEEEEHHYHHHHRHSQNRKGKIIIELENDFGVQDDDDFEHPSEQFKHFAASVAILAGTAVGSGCLAIPRATAPAGVIPSSSAMTLVWAFLCFSALCIVESVEATSRKMKRKDVPLHAVAEQVRAKNEKYYTIRSFVSFRFVSFRAFGTHNSAVCLLFTHHLNAFLVLSLFLSALVLL